MLGEYSTHERRRSLIHKLLARGKQTEKYFILIAARRPSITKLRSTEVKLDERLSLLCRAKGFPPPKILWYKNGVNLEHPPSRRGLSVRRRYLSASVTIITCCIPHHCFIGQYRKRTSTIRIRKASLRDAGIYRCVAVNVLGSAESEATVNVSVPTVTLPVMTLNRKSSAHGYLAGKMILFTDFILFITAVTDSWVFQGIPCQERDFCLNGGICKFYPRLNARSCKYVPSIIQRPRRCATCVSMLGSARYFVPVSSSMLN